MSTFSAPGVHNVNDENFDFCEVIGRLGRDSVEKRAPLTIEVKYGSGVGRSDPTRVRPEIPTDTCVLRLSEVDAVFFDFGETFADLLPDGLRQAVTGVMSTPFQSCSSSIAA